MPLSVIICTHQPRLDTLQRTLESLRMQTLPTEQWELVVVDNASESPIEQRVSIGWHPRGGFVRETGLGLTSARLRGIAEAKGDVLVFVDDDNVLDSAYLAEAMRVSEAFSALGAWGAGELIPEFETPPLEWSRPLWNRLALGTVARDAWTNQYYDYECLPRGAGLCLRRTVADFYARACGTQSERRGLDRAGQSLASGGDMDLAMCACDLGLGVGRFRALKVTHIIPPGRLELNYLLRLVEADAESNVILRALRGHGTTARAPGLGRILRNAWLRLRLPLIDYQVYRASQRGTDRGLSRLPRE